MKTIDQTKRRKRLSHIIIGSILVGLGIAILLAILVVAKIIKSAPEISTLKISSTRGCDSFVYDGKGNIIDKFTGAENREYANLGEIPKQLQQAVIAIEDKHFYQHNGMDLSKIGGALIGNLKSGSLSAGGTTITGQIIKDDVELTVSNPIERKIQEQYLAIQFEKLYSKDVILEYYLNEVGLGQGIRGVEIAASRYFGKDVSELNLTECAVLAVIIERPNYYNPLQNPDKNWEKVQVVLTEMEKQGYITKAEKIEALKVSPYEEIKRVHTANLENAEHNYFVDAVYRQVIEDLQQQSGITRAEAIGMVHGDGLRIYTTLDSDIQASVEKYMDDETLYPKKLYKVSLDYKITGIKADGTPIEEAVYGKVVDRLDMIEDFKVAMKKEWGITKEDKIEKEVLISQPQPQAAFVVTDYRTGQVKALYGGRGDKTTLSFDYATQALRHPASTLKVLAAYAPAIDKGLYTPESTFTYENFSIKMPVGTYSPKDLGRTYNNKPISLKDALAQSSNTIAVRTIYEGVGLDVTFDYLKAFGFENLAKEDKTWALPFGALKEGVSALELTSAYATIANKGVYIKPTFYTKVTDYDGNVILDAQSETEVKGRSHIVLKETTATSLTQMLKYAGDREANLKDYFNTMPVAGKEGLSANSNDVLFAGYTPYYAATMWSGYNRPDKLKDPDNYQIRLWGKIMNEIHKGYKYQEFEQETK